MKLTKTSLSIAAFISLLLLCGICNATEQSLQIVKQWKLLNYNFPPNLPVNDATFYNPQNILITGIAVNYDRIFVATPKLFSGVPSTLNVVSKANFGDSPILEAYPDWSFYTTGRKDFNCSDLVLISIYRLRIDSCNRLWVLDAGVSRSLEDYEVTCPPKILIFDLYTNQVVRRVDFPSDILRGETLFTNLVIDETTATAGTCDDVFVYISDTVEPGIIVYDSGRDVTWRVSHPAMYPDPDFAQSEILGDRFVLMDGIVGLTFDEKSGTIYFQPLATDRVFSVSKEVLRSGPIAINQVLDVKLVGKKSSQGISLAFSPLDGNLIFSPLSETAIAAWNPHSNQQTVLSQDKDRLQFVADMTTTRSEPGVLYAISSKFHRFFLKNLNPHELNNRIVRINLNIADPHAFSLPSPGHSIRQFSTINSPSHFSNHLQPFNNYFSSSTAVSPKNPFGYHHLDTLSYKVQQPFTVLNQGESFPPVKGHRNTFQISFLDGLSGAHASLPGATRSYQTIIPSGRKYYYYGRSLNDPATPDDKLIEK